MGRAHRHGDIQQSSFSNLFVTSRTSQLILQPFRRFTYVTAHSPTLPLLHLHHSSLSSPSFASPTSQALHLCHLASRPCCTVGYIRMFSTTKFIKSRVDCIIINPWELARICMYIWGFRARQHLRSLAPVMNDGQMIFGDLWGPKVSRHLSYRWGETPKKPSPRKLVPTGDRTRARCGGRADYSDICAGPGCTQHPKEYIYIYSLLTTLINICYTYQRIMVLW